MDLINKQTISDLLTEDELKLYSITVYPFNLSILHKALMAKLQEDPDYVVWAPLVYYKCLQYIKDDKSPLAMHPHRVYINNKGDIISGSVKGLKELSKIPINDYLYTAITRDKRQFNVMVHRAVACTFIPVDPKLGPAHPNHLQVNHLDGIKINCDVGNLEWCTPVGNMEHAIRLGLKDYTKKRKK